MLIEVNTDKNIEGSERLIAYCKSTLEAELDRFSEHITRIEVHFADENGAKKGEDDKRCMIEARMKGQKPLVVTDHASSIDFALNGAIDKITKVLDTTLAKQRSH